MRELDVLTDRDRIARDLHDHVIQRLFAVGLNLQGAIPRARTPEVQQRLNESVDDLQAVIQEIRTAIFDLHGGQSGSTRLRQRLDEAIAQFADPHMRTTVQFSGPLSVVDAGLADHAEAVVREAVSNAVRHAQASTVGINVNVGDDLCIEVTDDGRGIEADVTSSGLANLRHRAEESGGSFSVEALVTGGTKLRWCAPLP
jgi:signal transduction histidine kinase